MARDAESRWIRKEAGARLGAGELLRMGMEKLLGRGGAPTRPAVAAHSRASRAYPPEFTADLPDWLLPAGPPPAPEELRSAGELRERYCFEGETPPYMVDVIRAHRIVGAVRRYLEIGTWDKGHLAYVAGRAAEDALLVDVDREEFPAATRRLEADLRPGQRLHTATGHSAAPETAARVEEALAGERVDLLVLDADHRADAVLADYARYAPRVRPGGFVFVRGPYWSGDAKAHGTAVALAELDRIHPVYVVFRDDPLHRFLPWMTRGEIVWGGVAILRQASCAGGEKRQAPAE